MAREFPEVAEGGMTRHRLESELSIPSDWRENFTGWSVPAISRGIMRPEPALVI